ncbi:MAG: universal stress protein [Thermoplasmata archaeon]|nr:universal stress protein [Thermoplasmata archaeon]
MRPKVFSRILVALDGSSQSGRAGRAAIEVAEKFHARVTLATVLSTKVGSDEAYLDSLVPKSEEGKSLLTQIEELTREAKARGVEAVESVSLRGPVAEAILEYVSRNPQDLLVVGSRGLSRGSRIVLRSVSEQLIHESPCAVLVVRPARKART